MSDPAGTLSQPLVTAPTLCGAQGKALLQWWVCRWSSGGQFDAPTPSYVTLQRFEAWVKQHQPRRFFNEILRQIAADFPEDAAHAQVGDTYAMLARPAPASRPALLRNAGRKVLFYWAQVEPAHPVTCLPAHALHPALAGSTLLATLFGPPRCAAPTVVAQRGT
ncbi:MAG: hypothetical protein IPK16_18680 [Anaerolineales bacterium]|nr:hypothetical protein [Anaerolineales bacterium]